MKTRSTTKKHFLIDPSSNAMSLSAVALVGILAAVSFMMSFTALVEVARWAAIPQWLRWSVPVVVDVAILAYSITALVHRARGRKTLRTWTVLGVFTAVSVLANALHALSAATNVSQGQRITGTVIAGIAPIALFLATEEIARLTVHDQAATPVAPPQVDTATTDTGVSDVIPSTNTPAQLAAAAPVELPRTEPQTLQVSTGTSTVVEPELEDISSAETAADAAPVDDTENPAAADESPIPTTTPDPVTVGHTATAAESEGASTATASTAELDELRDWVLIQAAAGQSITGALLAEHLGVSARTGRNRLNKLKEQFGEDFYLLEDAHA